ncbi:GNAT family N-acetyltransferase [Prauserella muralis]|uniref:GCN5 family acetyltransferase n=1 Tax=Prauserella muralis TaxID=588067 RepID=A0A2V4BCV5_9PSEU|nr:GNAT family N-acetyltransferase [Prauserella muralis]PXY32342.1 GCN5 family acetyltransferase [Prauserella muralis]TWE23976.1 RimJ/RimL family protein N-acetyltransferase [Prauserella muralis]
MEPVEINAGTYYLRQLRADDRLDDRPALVEAFTDPTHVRFVPGYLVDTPAAASGYIARRAGEWARGERCSWAVAHPVTGALLGEVGLKKLDFDAGTAETAVWVHPAARGQGVATTAVGAALRFGFDALGLRTIDYLHEPDNHASAGVAKRCGFTFAGPVPETGDVRWTRGADDPA